jgi:hypothetical protein
MTEPRNTPQDFQTTPRPKRKRNLMTTSSEATTSFLSPNQFAVLSESESYTQENGAPLPTTTHLTRIPPIVIYGYLNNHSSTLKQVNEKLTTPVEVKYKTNRLLLYTQSSHDYNILLTEIQTANLAYHTYPLPEAVQPRLVLNVPEEDVRVELASNNIQRVKIIQLTKTDKTTRTVINKYPTFVITFQSGTDMRKVLQLHKLWHCIIRWEKFHNSRPIRQCFNWQSFGHSSNFCGRPSKCVKCDQQHASKDCTKPAGCPPKCVNCGGEHPANYTGCPQYLRQLHYTPQVNNQQQRKPQNIKTHSHISPTVMGSSGSPGTIQLYPAINRFSIWILTNYLEHVQPTTSMHPDASASNYTTRNKRPYRQSSDGDRHGCQLFLHS